MVAPAQSRLIGQRIIRYASVASTNDLSRARAEQGDAEGLVISAEEQTAGRGRMGRPWRVPPRTSLQFSILLRPHLEPRYGIRLTQFAALALVKTLRDELKLAPTLKWHNDVLLNGKKCAGILVEASLEENKFAYAIVGIGLNVNYSMRDYAELAPFATTLADELGQTIDRALLERALFAKLDAYYSRLCAGEDFRDEWRAQMSTLGQFIRAQTPWGNEEGFARDLDAEGRLIIERRDGSRVKLVAGDVTLAVSR